MKKVLILMGLYILVSFFSYNYVGEQGFIGFVWQDYSVLKLVFYMAIMTHITISCMSLSFHRAHTHKGIKINSVVDFFMQTWLYLITGMSKLDWVSIHSYHHAHSDKVKDPHSPVQKGFFRVFFLGTYDYVKAKEEKAVARIKEQLVSNKIERFYDNNPMLGLVLTTFINLMLFGWFYGTIISLINFTISPLFAVGGVNALAHTLGYRNHKSDDNSRNIGFLYPLNWLICGELDHNNHHAHPRSCSFRHRWYEFDIGYFYIKVLSKAKLVKVLNVYRPRNLNEKISKQLLKILDQDSIQARINEIALDFNQNYEEVKRQLVARIEGQRKTLEPALENLILDMHNRLNEMKRFKLVHQ